MYMHNFLYKDLNWIICYCYVLWPNGWRAHYKYNSKNVSKSKFIIMKGLQ